MDRFSQFLKQFRRDRGIIQEKLAQRTGCDRSLISKYEKGKATPSEKFCEALAKEFNLDAEHLHILAGRLPAEIEDSIKKEALESMLKKYESAIG